MGCDLCNNYSFMKGRSVTRQCAVMCVMSVWLLECWDMELVNFSSNENSTLQEGSVLYCKFNQGTSR